MVRGVDVFFADRKFGETCASQRELRRKVGEVRAKRIMLRLQQLRVADDLADLRHVTGRVHALGADLQGLVALDLDGPYRLLIEPLWDLDGPVEWEKVTQVLVVGVDDYH